LLEPWVRFETPLRTWIEMLHTTKMGKLKSIDSRRLDASLSTDPEYTDFEDDYFFGKRAAPGEKLHHTNILLKVLYV